MSDALSQNDNHTKKRRLPYRNGHGQEGYLYQMPYRK
jgi:hypothetical protein